MFIDSRIVESQTQILNVYLYAYHMYNVYVSIIDIISMIMFAIRQCGAWASASITHTYIRPKKDNLGKLRKEAQARAVVEIS